MGLSSYVDLEGLAHDQNPIRRWVAALVRRRGFSGIVSLADQAVVSGTSFLTGVLVGRACTQAEFGLYTLGLSIIVFIVGLQTSLISSPYTVYSPRISGVERALYAGSSLVHQLGLSIAVIVALLLAGLVFSTGVGPDGLGALAWVLAGVTGLITLREFVRRVCFARIRMTSALVMDSCVAMLQLGGLAALFHFGLISPMRAYLVVGAASGLVAVGWLFAMRSGFRVELATALSHLKRNWRLAKWLVAGSLLLTAGMSAYPWLLAGMHGTAATGILGACMGVAFLAHPFFLGLRNFLDPRASHGYARGGKREVRSVVGLASLLTVAIMGCFCLVILVFGGWLVTLIYGPQYAGNDAIVRVLAVASAISVIGMPAYSGLLAMERSDIAFKSYLVALILVLTVGLWLVGAYGVLGAAIGLLVSNLGSSAVRWVAFHRGVR
jgi:O-antigen/teichoic acid export membrane protein